MAIARSSIPCPARAMASIMLCMLALGCICPAATQEACDAATDDAQQAHSLIQTKRTNDQKSNGGHRQTKAIDGAAQAKESKQKLNIRKETKAPCACHANDPTWKPPAARKPRCVFIDLGAAHGNTFQNFLDDGFGPVKNCPSGGAWEAVLVEANPRFKKPLVELQTNYSGQVTSKPSSAAYMCEGNTSFYLDTVDVDTNFWGSSLSPNHNDVIRSGLQKVTVPLVNVNRLIAESVLPEDYVLLKVDIEGAEHDILPCLVQSNSARLIDALFLEVHGVEWSLGSSDGNATMNSVAALKAEGVWVPDYHSPTL